MDSNGRDQTNFALNLKGAGAETILKARDALQEVVQFLGQEAAKETSTSRSPPMPPSLPGPSSSLSASIGPRPHMSQSSSARNSRQGQVNILDRQLDIRQSFSSLFSPYQRTTSLASASGRQRSAGSVNWARAGGSGSSGGKRPRFTPKETWTHDFFCLAKTNKQIPPNRNEKEVLQDAGLGRKKLCFDKKGDALHVKQALEAAFPKLHDGGGFEILRSGSGPSQPMKVLMAPSSGYSVNYLRDVSGLGQALAYLRPIQRNLDTSPTSPDTNSGQPESSNYDNAPKVDCFICGMSLPITQIKDHTTTCKSQLIEEQQTSITRYFANEPEDSDKEDDNCTENSSVETHPTHSPDTFQRLKEMFPEVDEEIVTTASINCKDLNAATEMVLQQVEAAEFDDDVPLVEAARSYRESQADIESHLTELKHDDERQVIDIDREHPLLQCIRLLKQKRLNLKQSPDINFVGEDGIDAEGLTREFLSLLLCSIREGEDKIRLFEGQYPNLVPIHSTDYLASRLFFYVGQLIAYSYAHGQIGFVGMSPAICAFLVHGSIDSSCSLMAINDIADFQLREIIERVNDAKSEEEINLLAVDPEIATVISNSGFIEPLSTRNKQRALHYIMLNDIVLKRKSELEQLRDGLNHPFKIIDFLSTRHEKEARKVFPHPEDVKLAAADIKRIIITETSYQLSDEEEKVFTWLHQFIEQIGNRTDLDAVGLSKFMMFISGSELLPKGKITVKFCKNGGFLPDPDSCFLSVKLPLVHDSYQNFAKAMDTAIACQYRGTGRF